MTAPKKRRRGRPIREKTPEEMLAAAERVAAQYELDILDKQILKIKSLDPFIDCRTIAKKLGVNFATVSLRLKKPRFKMVWDSIMETTTEAMEKNARKAAQRLSELIGHKNERIALEAIKLALSPWINQHSHQISVAPTVTYKTTVQADSTLLQEVVEAEVLPQPVKEIEIKA